MVGMIEEMIINTENKVKNKKEIIIEENHCLIGIVEYNPVRYSSGNNEKIKIILTQG
jgi:hypothetical protein